MAYGLNPQLFVENGPAITAAGAQGPRSSLVYRGWRGLNPERRLTAVENALRPANDVIDGYPLAL